MKKEVSARQSFLEWGIAIIIVAGFVLGVVVMSPSGRPKSIGAAVKGNLAGIRTNAELYFDTHNNTYGKVSVPLGACPLDLGSDDNLFFERSIRNALKAVTTHNKDVLPVCVFDADASKWAISSQYLVPMHDPWYKELLLWISRQYKAKYSVQYWCVDSTGASREVPHHITEAKCPEGVAR